MATPLSKGLTGEYTQGENYTVSGNDNWRLLNAFVLDQWANDPATTTGLTYGYRGGMADDSAIMVAGTIALTASMTNYVERTSSGTVSTNVIGFTAGQISMAIIVTDGSAITTITDCRRLGTAQLAGPAFTGVPQAPTAAIGTNTTQLATTAFVQQNAVTFALFDAKGDLIAGTGVDAAARLAVGANNKVLMADSTQTTGIKWGDAVLPTLVDAKGDLLVGTANDVVARLAVGSNGFALIADSGQASGLKYVAWDVALPIIVGDGSNVVPTGLKAVVEIPFACTITAARIVSNDATSGSIVFDIWKDTFVNSPPTGADTITGSNKPTLSSAIHSEQLSFGTWSTTSFAAGDWIAINVDSAASVKLVTLSLTFRRT